MTKAIFQMATTNNTYSVEPDCGWFSVFRKPADKPVTYILGTFRTKKDAINECKRAARDE